MQYLHKNPFTNRMQGHQFSPENAGVPTRRLARNGRENIKAICLPPCLIILLFLAACTGTPCTDIPSSFSTYDEAITTVESATFSISESVNTSKSSFINDADFYSCNGQDGFLILQFKENDYIFQGVPVEVWEGFKNAESFGEFYDHKIRGRYRYHSN